MERKQAEDNEEKPGGSVKRARRGGSRKRGRMGERGGGRRFNPPIKIQHKAGNIG